MKTLESLFQRFGSPAEEMNERINIYGMRADCIKDMKHIRSEDERARRTISEMLEYIETLKEYRKTLFDRAQEICAASYRLQIKIKRSIDCWYKKKYYTVTLSKIYDEAAHMTPDNVIAAVLPPISSNTEKAAPAFRFLSSISQKPARRASSFLSFRPPSRDGASRSGTAAFLS